MRAGVWCALGALLLAASVRPATSGRPVRRVDQDFEFDDDAIQEGVSAVGAHSRRPRRYIYDPHNALCRSLVCEAREVCLLRDSLTALCAQKKDILRRGDVIVTASSAGSSAARDEADDDDVFYDAAPHDAAEPALEPDLEPDDTKRCVGCGAARAAFVCGSDNRTYSSLCRLDLHNCVRRSARPVRLACRGFCPCARPPHPTKSIPVAPATPNARRRKFGGRGAAGSENCSLDKMANRLLDWFSVLMDEAGAEAPPPDGFPADCKPEVRWMFAHLDTDGDGVLSPFNLYALRHARDRCIGPFVAACERQGGREGREGRGARGGRGARRVGRAAWCGCLARAARPCTALARAHPAPGAWRPACDARGYYRPRQCHAALGVCWCVDAHGRELPSSRTKGAPDCPGSEGAPADDEDGGGSGDGDVRF